MITSTANPRVKRVRALQSQRRARERERRFVVEGLRLASEAAASGLPAELVLHTGNLDSRGRAVVNQLARLGAEVETTSAQVMQACSDTLTPQGLLVVLPFPAPPLPAAPTFALVLDRVADPGNLGAILRAAAAAGVEAVFLTPGTVDPFNPKVVRAGMGAHFHLPLQTMDWPELTRSLAGLDRWLAAAITPHGRAGLRYDQVDWRRPCALVIGSEAEGAGQAARAFAPDRVYIPMPGRAESLNASVAAGVLLFEVVRQRLPVNSPAAGQW
ncbi:MAG: RNA methyltransferase [Chloroflexi bacterium]|nr:RNA methyltransferase [Chloroflexota bacterium]